MKKVSLILAPLALLSVAVFPTRESAPPLILDAGEGVVNVALVGDIMLDRGVASSVRKHFSGSWGELFKNIPEIRAADVAFGNLEGPVAASGRRVGSKYSFRMNPTVLPALQDAGFDVLSFANNHVGDWGMDAFKETLSGLSAHGIAPVGAGLSYGEAAAPRVVVVGGIRIGFLGFSDVGPSWMATKKNTPGILLASDPNLPALISEAKQSVDRLFVSFHWGEEYRPATARARFLAAQAIDAGADVVVGHHPHVIQAFEYYKGKPVFYSLGNFIFDQYDKPETMRGMVGMVRLYPNGALLADLFTTELSRRYQPGPLRAFQESDAVLDQRLARATCPTPAAGKIENHQLLSLPHDEITLKNYVPKSLVLAPFRYSGGEPVCLTKETLEQYEAMREAMRKEGLEAHIVSGYRDAATQARIKNSFERSGMGSVAADVGASEHHLGTTLDLTSATTAKRFIETPEYAWMQKHAFRFGFVQSYPGKNGEQWHWRYIGRELARAVRRSGEAVNDYLEKRSPL